jgi:hypothetical protein
MQGASKRGKENMQKDCLAKETALLFTSECSSKQYYSHC